MWLSSLFRRLNPGRPPARVETRQCFRRRSTRVQLAVEPLEEREVPALGDFLHTLANPTPAAGEEFGAAVSVSGNLAVVGAPNDETGGVDTGAAFLLDATSGVRLHTFPNPTPASGDDFGASVSVSGNLAVVGAPLDDAGAANAGAAYLFDTNSGARLHTFTKPTPAVGDFFGQSVSVSGNLVLVGAPDDDTGGLDAGAAYLFDASSGALLHTFLNPTPTAGDLFGFSVSVSGNLVLVGADDDDTGAPDAGAAYLFDATSGALLRTFNNPTPAAGDQFGYSVSVSGNLVVVGAWLDDTGAPDAGSAYLFDATSGALLRTLNNPTPAPVEVFGISVAVAGDLVAVAAVGESIAATDPGAAYLFDATSGARLRTLLNVFGSSVALSGNRVVVGAPQDDTGAQHAGAAYVFDAPQPPRDFFAVLSSVKVKGKSRLRVEVRFAGNGALKSQFFSPFQRPTFRQVRVFAVDQNHDDFNDAVEILGVRNGQLSRRVVPVAAEPTAGRVTPGLGDLLHTLPNRTPVSQDFFGSSVSVSGNLLVVGAPNKGADDAGAAYLIDANSGVPLRTRDFPTPTAFDNFGGSVAVSGSLVLVGVPRSDRDALNSGLAYLLDANTGTPLRTFNNPTPAENDFFGYSVALSGNLVVVAALSDDTAGTDTGSVYLFDASTGELLHTLTSPTPTAFDNFGGSVAVSGNLVAVGADRDDTGAQDAGSAYLFDATSGALVRTLANPTPVTDDNFGGSVAVSGNLVVVGAKKHDVGQPGGLSAIFQDAGAAYLFDATSGALLRTFTNPSAATGDFFGASVALSGNLVVVGAPQDDTGAKDAGAAYLFDANSGARLRTLNNPRLEGSSFFGISVAVSGDRVVVGASGHSTATAMFAGAAYLFEAPSPPRDVFAVLASVPVKKKTRLRVELRFTDNQALKSQLFSPFQKPTFRQVRVFALDQNRDGINDAVLVLALRQGKLSIRVFPA